MKKQRIILPLYKGHMLKQLKEAGYSNLMFELPYDIRANRMTALLDFDEKRNEKIWAFLKIHKKFRLVLEEI